MQMFLALVVCGLGVAMATPVFLDPELDDMWECYKKNHNKQYQDDEKMRRFTWESNLRYINRHNLEADLGMHTFTLGMNVHGDLSDAEYGQFLLGHVTRNSSQSQGAIFMAPENVVLPDTVDWREKGYVTGVKDQGHCGSCWAFAATGSLEGQYFKKTGKLVSMSEQNLVDCSTKEGNKGCKGGNMDSAYKYVRLQGIDSEASYPYEMKDDTCRFKEADVVTKDKGFVDIIQFSEDDLQKAVATQGPVGVAIDASQSTFRFYKRGVYVDEKCSSHKLDHGVLAVGYGVENGDSYWLVKNSWGKTWGNEGYINMARNHDNMCGIATDASYPLL